MIVVLYMSVSVLSDRGLRCLRYIMFMLSGTGKILVLLLYCIRGVLCCDFNYIVGSLYVLFLLFLLFMSSVSDVVCELGVEI